MPQLPDDYDAGPLSETEFADLKADEEAEAKRQGYHVDVQRVPKDGQLFAHVAHSAVAAQHGSAATAGAAATTGAAVGAVLGAAIAGPIGAGVGAAVGAAAGGRVGTAGATPNQEIAAAMRAAASRVGVDSDLLAGIAWVESSLRPAIKSPTSSAFGLFQFLDATWADVVTQHGASLGVGVADRGELEAQCLMGAAFLRDNERALRQRLGRQPTDAECYAAHFFGAGTAAEFLSSPHSQSADQALGARAQQVIAANEPIFFDGPNIRTVGEVLAVFQGKIAGAISEARQKLGPLSAAPPGSAAAPSPAPAPGPANAGTAWGYSQSTGTLTHAGRQIAIGYSGHGAGKNNPALQTMPNVGPIPQGRYSIGNPHDSEKVGPFALPLTPIAGTNTFGRSDFLIHGDSVVHPGTASEGCIILLRDARQQIAESGDRELLVTA